VLNRNIKVEMVVKMFIKEPKYRLLFVGEEEGR
jgi:hypothetical protein